MRIRGFGLVACLALLCLAQCGASDSEGLTGFTPPSGPSSPPPTGQRWEDVDITDACGRTSTAWLLVDEVCGGVDRDDYLEGFRVPMFRDGAVIGHQLYTVDATHLWVLDVQDPLSIHREALVSGLGEPLAVEANGTDLVIASADGVLHIVDASEPAAPTRKTAVPLPGPALSVRVHDGVAYVAMGAAGIAVVALGEQAALTDTIEVPGYAAAVTVRGDYAFVAACSTFHVVNLVTKSVQSSVWHPEAFEDGRLVAPAKDVEVVDDVAFVAAGRYGAVTIDVSDPSAPRLMGNCTERVDQAFYVSGIRADDTYVYLAAGEWGVKRVSRYDPMCVVATTPELPEAPVETDTECSAEPPWKLVPWEDLWAPPPPDRDPVQVLPVGDLVYAFGDATRIGIRAVDARANDSPDLQLVGRYDEPRLAVSVAASEGRVLVIGEGGGLFQRDDDLLLRRSGTLVSAGSGRMGRFLPDGRVAILMSGDHVSSVHIDDVLFEPSATLGHVESFDVVGSDLFMPVYGGVLRVDVSDPTDAETLSHAGLEANTPPVVAARDERVFLAAAEWTATLASSTSSLSAMQPHGLFDEDDVLDVGAWTTGVPHRLLAPLADGLVEIVSFGGHARLVVHGSATRHVTLPDRSYLGLAADEGFAYAVAQDRALYRSSLVTVALSEEGPRVVSTSVFTGTAMGMALDGDRLYVADADAGIRVYAREAGALELLGVVDPLEAP